MPYLHRSFNVDVESLSGPFNDVFWLVVDKNLQTNEKKLQLDKLKFKTMTTFGS